MPLAQLQTGPVEKGVMAKTPPKGKAGGGKMSAPWRAHEKGYGRAKTRGVEPTVTGWS